MAKNTTILEGTILNEPKLRSTRSGVDVSNFTLMIEGEELNSSFKIGITAWGKSAVECAFRLKRGARVCVNGKLGMRSRVLYVDGVPEKIIEEMEVQAENVFSVS
jgi:single-stranded DNA-binding protein